MLGDQGDRPYLDPSQLEPAMTQKGRWKPQVGARVTIDVPGERILCECIGVYSPDAINAKILVTPASRQHALRRGQVISARRETAELTYVEIWRMVDEWEVKAAQEAARFAREQTALEEQKERERIAEKQRLEREAAEVKPPEPEEPPPFKRFPGSRRSKVAPTRRNKRKPA